jgi:precorrin-6B methylase 2
LKNPKDLLTSLSPNSSEFTSLITGSVEGLKRYYVIVTALDTGLFESTIMPKTAKAIAEELGSYHPLMVEMFCDALAEMGLLTKQEDKYVNSNLASTYLCQKSSHYMENTLQNLKKSVDRWATLPSILKNGPIMQKRDDLFGANWLRGIAEWAEIGSVAQTLKVVKDHVNVQRWMRLIDLGGGHGLYAIGFTALNPRLRAYVYDLPRVAPVTKEYIEEYGADQVQILSGDFTKDDIGKGYDAVFSSFNPSCNEPEMIQKIVQALSPGGDLILRRFKDSSREGALQRLDWNLQGFEGKKIGSRPHSSDSFVNRETYLEELKASGLYVAGTFSVDEISEITFARKS